MSLEQKVEDLTGAISVLTDALHQHATTLRAVVAGIKMPDTLPQLPGKTPPADSPPAAPPEAKKGPGRPRKEAPPPAPLDLSAEGATDPTPDTAPGAASGSAVPDKAAGTYDDLKVLVPQVAEKHGRGRVLAVYASMGVANGQELLAKFPAKIPAVVEAFRSALAD
jgi:hypothetical protein